jgi:anti-anti-sigma regulatory factor
MTTTTTTIVVQAHIAYELLDDSQPEVVAIEFLSRDITSPLQACELGDQLASLIESDLPQNFVIDFRNVQSLGSTAFGEIVAFARKLGRLYVCNLHLSLRLGAALIGLDNCAEFAANRREAINGARRSAMQDGEDTIDYPASWTVISNAS